MLAIANGHASVICEGMNKDIAEDYYEMFRRRQRVHRMHLVGCAVFAALILIGMLLFWR